MSRCSYCRGAQELADYERCSVCGSHIAPSATVVSDVLWCFCAATLVDAGHERIVTGGGKASMALPQFKWVNTLLGNLKTVITVTYEAFDFAKYAHRYLAEFEFRFNHAST